MNVFRQLVREFWFPLLLGIAWTAFNILEKPNAQWSVREVVNILGPTFFLASWLVAQWYRVRKQQRVEDDLKDIQAGVRAIQEPLLPCEMFLTISLNAATEDVDRVFRDRPGYHAYGPTAAMPPMPFGLPPGVRDGRVMRKDGYTDYRDGVVEAAGIFRLNHPGYNLIHRSVSHTIASIDTDGSERLSAGPLFAPASATVEFYFGSASGPDNPSLVLKTGFDAATVLGAYALDEAIFTDVRVKPLSPAGGATSVGSDRLRGSRVRITLDFFYLEDMQSYPIERWPSVHNLQLWLGGKGRQVLTFSPDQLRRQVRRENPEPPARGAGAIQVIFDCRLDTDVYAKGLVSVA